MSKTHSTATLQKKEKNLTCTHARTLTRRWSLLFTSFFTTEEVLLLLLQQTETEIFVRLHILLSGVTAAHLLHSLSFSLIYPPRAVLTVCTPRRWPSTLPPADRGRVYWLRNTLQIILIEHKHTSAAGRRRPLLLVRSAPRPGLESK